MTTMRVRRLSLPLVAGPGCLAAELGVTEAHLAQGPRRRGRSLDEAH